MSVGGRMARWVVLLLLLLLAACDSPGPAPVPTLPDTPTAAATAIAIATAPATATAMATATTATAFATATIPAPPSPTGTPTALPPTATSTGAPTATPAALPTSTPEATPAPVYVFPVQPPGVTSFEAYHHDYPATDIFCPVGSRFVAPTAGVVDYVSLVDKWDPNVDDPATRGGLSVAIIGDDGVRYYGSHLSAVQAGIEPGVRVRAGQLLGKTGHSGDARFTDPHLHFGISHPTTPGDWKVRRGEVSPYKYLLAWKAGKPLLPVLK